MKAILLIMIGLSSLSMTQESSKFIKVEGGIVTDNKTTLEWQDDYSDNDGNIKFANWIDSINYCETLSLNGKDDWRLPNKKELLSIVDYDASNPAISSIFKKTTSKYYWSSSTYRSETNSAWYINFIIGNVGVLNKSRNIYVRCVRDSTKDISNTLVYKDNFDTLDSFENNWTQKTSNGCCGAGNPATYKVENGKLILTTNGGSDGYMGIGDGSYFVPNHIVLKGDFAIEVSIKELMREKTNGYKDNSGVGLYLTTANSLETSIVDIGIGGNYSGYFEGYSYNQYNGHRVSAYNPITKKHVFIDELDLNKLYDLKFKIQRVDNKFTIFYKLSSSSQWVEHSTTIKSSDDLIPILRIGSGDGGGTRQNGKFSASIDYIKVSK